MTAPDVLAVLTRADQRWATKQADDPAPTNYLEHLAAALAPLLRPGEATVDLDQVAEVEQLREERERALAQRHTANLNYEASRQEHLRTLEHLGRLVDAINEEWHPDSDVAAQVDRAVQLVTAAHDQLQQRHDDGEHIHTYTRQGTRTLPCTCGKPFPATRKSTSPSTGKKGAAA